jgi:hypothetical protein
MCQYPGSLPEILGCWAIEEQVLPIFNHHRASRAERSVSDSLSVQDLAGINSIQLNQPAKNLDPPWHLGAPDNFSCVLIVVILKRKIGSSRREFCSVDHGSTE